VKKVRRSKGSDNANGANTVRRAELLRKWEEDGELLPAEYQELRELGTRSEGDGSSGSASALHQLLQRDVQGEEQAVATSSPNAATVDAIMDRVLTETPRPFGDWWQRARTVGVAAAGVALLIGAAALFLNDAGFRPGAQERMARESVEAGTTVDTLVEGEGVPSDGDAKIVVRFELVAPEAERVSLVGDFNNWSQNQHILDDSDNDGVWEVEVPLDRGEVYTYNFLINDNEWIPDPRAVNHIEDSFGGEKSVLNL
jgi:hypothetical protein